MVSTEGTFTLVPGDYRISIFAKYFVNSAGSVMAGLYNITSAAFEVYSGTAEPVLLESTGTALAIDYDLRVLEAKITVASSTKLSPSGTKPAPQRLPGTTNFAESQQP